MKSLISTFQECIDIFSTILDSHHMHANLLIKLLVKRCAYFTRERFYSDIKVCNNITLWWVLQILIKDTTTFTDWYSLFRSFSAFSSLLTALGVSNLAASLIWGRWWKAQAFNKRVKIKLMQWKVIW